MSDESSDKYERDAPTDAEVKRGMKSAAKAFLKNRHRPKPERQAAVKGALKKAHPAKEK